MIGPQQGPTGVDALRAMLKEIVREVMREERSAEPMEYLSTAEAASVAKVSPGTIRRWIGERRLTPLGAGRHLRIERADLERMLKLGGARRRDRQAVINETPEQRAKRRFG